jgi:hypothetical protein
MLTQWRCTLALMSAARKSGNGFAYHTGISWTLRADGNMDNPWDFWLVWLKARFR